ncbi:MAG: hypothetical protein KGY76_05440 [Candidatus Thermoplasmatota archaeon]|nr:hypothetical protein [Candidatus Thermoplasmatota archaeon]
MPIKNFELKAIDAERYSQKRESRDNIRIDHNSSVTKIEKIDDKTNSIEFRFTANYSGMGMIKLEGNLHLLGKHPKLAKRWRKKNDMPNEVAQEIHSTIIKNCLPQAVIVARDIQLPPPIPLPEVNVPDGENSTKPSKDGMEVA